MLSTCLRDSVFLSVLGHCLPVGLKPWCIWSLAFGNFTANTRHRGHSTNSPKGLNVLLPILDRDGPSMLTQAKCCGLQRLGRLEGSKQGDLKLEGGIKDHRRRDCAK